MLEYVVRLTRPHVVWSRPRHCRAAFDALRIHIYVHRLVAYYVYVLHTLTELKVTSRVVARSLPSYALTPAAMPRPSPHAVCARTGHYLYKPVASGRRARLSRIPLLAARGSFAPSARSILAITALLGMALPLTVDHLRLAVEFLRTRDTRALAMGSWAWGCEMGAGGERAGAAACASCFCVRPLALRALIMLASGRSRPLVLELLGLVVRFLALIPVPVVIELEPPPGRAELPVLGARVGATSEGVLPSTVSPVCRRGRSSVASESARASDGAQPADERARTWLCSPRDGICFLEGKGWTEKRPKECRGRKPPGSPGCAPVCAVCIASAEPCRETGQLFCRNARRHEAGPGGDRQGVGAGPGARGPPALRTSSSSPSKDPPVFNGPMSTSWVSRWRPRSRPCAEARADAISRAGVVSQPASATRWRSSRGRPGGSPHRARAARTQLRRSRARRPKPLPAPVCGGRDEGIAARVGASSSVSRRRPLPARATVRPRGQRGTAAGRVGAVRAGALTTPPLAPAVASAASEGGAAGSLTRQRPPSDGGASAVGRGGGGGEEEEGRRAAVPRAEGREFPRPAAARARAEPLARASRGACRLVDDLIAAHSRAAPALALIGRPTARRVV